jgi:hypothetical protein
MSYPDYPCDTDGAIELEYYHQLMCVLPVLSIFYVGFLTYLLREEGEIWGSSLNLSPLEWRD